MSPITLPTFTSQLYAKLFTHVDTDASGDVTLQELDAVRQNMPMAGTSPLATPDSFKRLDKDASGTLQLMEMSTPSLFDDDTTRSLVALQMEDTRQAAEEAFLDDFFQRADLNGDGSISVSENEAETSLRRIANLGQDAKAGFGLLVTTAATDGSFTRDGVRGFYFDPNRRAGSGLPPEPDSDYDARMKEIFGKTDAMRQEIQGRLEAKGIMLRGSTPTPTEQAESDLAAPLSASLIGRLLSRLEAFSEGASDPFEALHEGKKSAAAVRS